MGQVASGQQAFAQHSASRARRNLQRKSPAALHLTSKCCLATLLIPLGGRRQRRLGALTSKRCLATLLDPLGGRTTYVVGLGALMAFLAPAAIRQTEANA